MGAVHLNGPDPGGRPCPMCLMAAKQHQWERFQEQIKAGFAQPADQETWIPWPADGPKILAGMYRAVPGEAPQLGIVDGLCWDHVAGFGASRPPALLDGKGIPPGLLKGRG